MLLFIINIIYYIIISNDQHTHIEATENIFAQK